MNAFAPTVPALRRALPALLALLPAIGGCATRAATSPPDGPDEGFAVHDPAAGGRIALAELVDRLSGADVVLFGELHDDPGAHLAQRRLLEALAARGARVTVGLEMFERDVQPALDAYLAGRTPEAAFLAAARPWPNFREAYRPVVEVARGAGWKVVASNVPRPLAASVASGGLEALAGLDPLHRSFAAAEVRCPRDEYFRRFARAVGAHPGQGGAGAGGGSPLDRMYEAQCLKDETMAESIVRAWTPGTLVVHLNGGFHSDHRLGIVPRLLRREPGLRVVVLTAVPEGDPRRAEPGRLRDLADFVVLTPRPTGR